MRTRVVCLLSLLCAAGASALGAEEGASKTALGTLMLSEKKYTLKHALAYETTSDGEEALAVVLSGQAVTNAELKEARTSEKSGSEGEFKRPFLRLVFKKNGELKYWGAAAGGTTIGRRSDSGATGECRLQEGRVIGKANQPNEKEGMFPASFDVHFETALLKPGDSLPESTVRKGGPAASVKPTVSGTFEGNGKDAKLAYVSARWIEPFADKPSIMLLFTEKDHSKEKKPDIGATFGKFGSALIISLHEDGGIFGCEVAHSAHKKQGFSSIGHIETSEFEYGDGKVEGELTTDGQIDTFGETWAVNLKFVAPLGEIPKEFQVAKKEEKPAAVSDADEETNDVESDKIAADMAFDVDKSDGPKAQELGLTKDASEVEYKAMVGQITFKSKADVKKTCTELAANLKAQGWTSDGPDLITPQSSILKRKQGGASLTIFVKPAAGGGSAVQMMTEGLSWE